MRSIILVLLFTAGFFAQADDVQCTQANLAKKLIYFPNRMSMEVSGKELKIVGTITYADDSSKGMTLFNYPLENGQSAEISWASNGGEILRINRGGAREAVLKDNAGQVVETYSTCSWLR